MMSEKLQQESEKSVDSRDIEENAAEHREILREQFDNKAEKSESKDVASLEKEAKEAAKAALSEKEKQHVSPAERRTDLVPTKKRRNVAFKKEMKQIQSEMSSPSRAFSKLIHNRVVDKASEVVGNTVARPNAMLAGSLVAFLLVGALYVWARYIGYPLSGFETIGAFIIGWLLGMIFDYLRILFTGKPA